MIANFKLLRSKLLSLLVILTLISCEKESISEIVDKPDRENTVQNPLKIEEFSFKDLRKDHEFNLVLESQNPNFILNRHNKEDEAIKIDSSKIKKITIDKTTSFTFLLKQENYQMNSFENLVIEIDSLGNNRAFIITYKIDDNIELFREHESFSFNGSIGIQSIDIQNSNLSRSMGVQTEYYCSYQVWCNYSYEHPAGPNCTRTYLKYVCEEETGGGGGGSGTYTPPTPSDEEDSEDPVVTSPTLTEKEIAIKNFFNSLTTEQKATIDPPSGEPQNAYKKTITDFLNKHYIPFKPFFDETGIPMVVQNFTRELINVLGEDEFPDHSALNFILEAFNQDKIYNDLDSNFLLSVNQHMAINTSIPDINPHLLIRFTLRCIRIKAEHPQWSLIRVYWEATKDIVHITLDVAGIIPVFGEPADILNGVIYTFEGDALNASLSYAGAIPFVGWLSTGTKMSIKVLNRTTEGLIGLVWKVGNDGIVDFGSREILKHVIGTVGSSNHAHHIMPWAFRKNPLVQKAANSDGGFNINEALNGIPLPSSSHLNGHNSIGGYNDTINQILQNNQQLIESMDNNEAYDFLFGLIQHIEGLITSNRNMNLGEIADLINYP